MNKIQPGITEKDRKEVLDYLLDKFKKKYGKRLLLFGVKGSMARGDFTPRSDIDTVIIIESGKGFWKEIYYKDITVDISTFTKKQAFDFATKISGYWPLQAGAVIAIKPLFIKDNIIKQIKSAVQKIPRETFIKSCWTHSMDEYFRKATNEYNTKNFLNLRYVAWELFFMACMNLGLINQKYYTLHGANTIKQFNQMKKFLPKGFKQKSKLCFDNSPNKVYEGCTYLFEQTKLWEKKFGYDKLPQNKKYKTIDELKI
jgi:predicted nucleotidyltransferase